MPQMSKKTNFVYFVWQLSVMAVVQDGSCPGWQLSSTAVVQYGSCPYGRGPYGSCLYGSCPYTLHSTSTTELLHHSPSYYIL